MMFTEYKVVKRKMLGDLSKEIRPSECTADDCCRLESASSCLTSHYQVNKRKALVMAEGERLWSHRNCKTAPMWQIFHCPERG